MPSNQLNSTIVSQPTPPSPSKTIAIVLLNWNGEELLKQFLPSVIRYSQYPNVTIIVADNSSSDKSIELLQTEFPGTELILLDQNYGFAGGYNKALKQVNADFYLLLNTDIEVTPGWLEPFLVEIEKESCKSVYMPKIRSFKSPDHFEYAGAAGGFIDRWGYTFCRGRIFNVLETDHGQYNQPGPVFWASGAAFMIDSKAFWIADGFDETFFAHMEEIDLCWRLKNRGFEIWYLPQSLVYHVGGATLNQSHPRKTYLNFRNNLFMLFKNLPKNRFTRTMWIRLVMDGIAAVKFLVSGETGFFWAVLKAHLAFYSRLPYLIQRRKQSKKQQTTSVYHEMYPGSLVYDFFIRKKRVFNDLDFKI